MRHTPVKITRPVRTQGYLRGRPPDKGLIYTYLHHGVGVGRGATLGRQATGFSYALLYTLTHSSMDSFTSLALTSVTHFTHSFHFTDFSHSLTSLTHFTHTIIFPFSRTLTITDRHIFLFLFLYLHIDLLTDLSVCFIYFSMPM